MAFINGKDVNISNLVIENCSINYSIHYCNNFASAVLISEISNVQLMNVTVSHSLGSALSLINIVGKATVNNSKFLGNIRSMNSTSSVFSIHYSVGHNSGDTVMNEAELLITNCSFTGNSQGDTVFDTIGNHMIMGLSLTFDECASNITTIVQLSRSGYFQVV